ncbi:energy transducer TonB [bacterium]|nr:energy transducer TonB [bacterium]
MTTTALVLRRGGSLTGLLIAAALVNVALFGLAGFLTGKSRPPQDITDPVGVSLVTLAPPEPPQQEEVKEPEPPPPAQEKPDFAPDLVQPSVMGAALDGLAVKVDIGGIGEPSGRETFIFDSVDLDQAPQAVVKVPPEFPYKAREQGIEGYVAVKFLVRADGTVGNVNVLKSKPKGQFEEAVRRALLQWKFQPGRIGGEAVASWVVTTIRFDLN